MNACAKNNHYNDNPEHALHILIVDDDRDLAESLQDMLELEYSDSRVDVTHSIATAHQYIRSNSPDIILIDIKLGSENGLDLVPFIKKSHPHSACIMMTAFRDTELAIKALRVGADNYILKPIGPRSLFKTIHHLHQQKRLERERDELEQRFKTLFNESVEALFLIDDRGNILDTNKAVTNSTGQDKSYFIGSNFANCSCWSVKDMARDAILNGINKSLKGESYSSELGIKAVDNSLKIFEFSFKPLPSISGNISLIFAEGHDVTDRKQYEEHLSRLNEELEERVKKRTIALEHASRAKSDFLSRMSHELRTPLNIILGYAQVLQMQEHTSFTEEEKDSINEIRNSGEHLLDLINDVLDLTSIEKNKLPLSLQPVSLLSTIGKVSKSLSVQAQNKNKTISINHSDDITVMADTTRLRQIIVNLMNNAINYGGNISISIEQAANNMARVNVMDDGPGIEKAKQALLFVPFERLGAEYAADGTGIGLCITEALVKMMGGNIGVESEQGKGANFWFELPIVHP